MIYFIQSNFFIMEISLALIGLIFILLAWLAQVIFSMLKEDTKMRPCFAGLQLIGISLLVADTLKATGAMDTLSWLNAATGLGALIMLVLILKK